MIACVFGGRRIGFDIGGTFTDFMMHGRRRPGGGRLYKCADLLSDDPSRRSHRRARRPVARG
jgi:N-methylhydantoinase A/oxoprolinase/acetone carboxylase beta subunit